MSSPSLSFGGNIIVARFSVAPTDSRAARKEIQTALDKEKPGAKLMGATGKSEKNGTLYRLAYDRIGYEKQQHRSQMKDRWFT